ncbi:dTDP-glucose 4,6-dehydratase [Candidatus Altiarchaeales archaeon WOR_SM1_SCG]|nr:dTDP-glucose 4,6-dehydratase [Candidatus Altiarchaeales archaeon WOR_SM1_SCG]
MKNILITGGAGFIGSNFVHHELKKHPGYEITVLDKLTYAGNLDNLKGVMNKIKFVKGDICDKKIVEKLIKNSDVVVNFAAETHVDRSIIDAGVFVKTDVIGTYLLLEASKKFNVENYIQISTDEVYGSIEDGSFTEESSLKPSSPYSASKAGADMLAHSYYITHNLPVMITRSSNNYGPCQYPEKIIPLFITNLLKGKKVPVYGDGLNVRDWLYVIDNCDAIDTVIEKGKTGEIYNISSGCEKTNMELTKKILELMDKSEDFIEYVKDRQGHDRRYSLNCEKIKKLGWKPKTEFEEGLKKTIEWYKNTGYF